MREPLSEALVTQTKAGLANSRVRLLYDLDFTGKRGIVGQSVDLTETTIGNPNDPPPAPTPDPTPTPGPTPTPDPTPTPGPAPPDAPEGATGLAPASMALLGALGALMM